MAASRAGGYPRPFTRPLYSTRGTRDGYNARFVPYFNSSDHMCFVEGIIGVPAVATINWDDKFIHSSDDDLYQIDQTQLHRNQFLTAATAFVLMNAGSGTVPLLAGETFAQGEGRIATDVQAAIRRLQDGLSGPDDGWADASALIEQGVAREIRAIQSCAVFAGTDAKAGRVITGLVSRAEQRQAALTLDLSAYYQQLHGAAPSLGAPDSLMSASIKKIPANVASLKDYFTNRASVSFGGSLHSLMRDEVYNFVDGKRSYYDIFQAVRSEQLAAGSWYYGTVTLRDVAGLLDAMVAAKALTLK